MRKFLFLNKKFNMNNTVPFKLLRNGLFFITDDNRFKDKVCLKAYSTIRSIYYVIDMDNGLVHEDINMDMNCIAYDLVNHR